MEDPNDEGEVVSGEMYQSGDGDDMKLDAGDDDNDKGEPVQESG
jgi:hypothetical protein